MIVHLVTDRRSIAGRRTPDRVVVTDALLDQVGEAVDAGVDVIQVRERDLEARQLAVLVSAIVRRAHGTRTRIVVNDRLDVALACGANGVHLRGDSMPPARVRPLAPRGFLVGRSVHDAGEAIAHQASVDYLVAGAVWPTASKPAGHALLGVDGLEAIVKAVAVPVIGIGGITVERAREVARVGAAGVAAIGLFQGGPAALPMRETVEILRKIV